MQSGHPSVTEIDLPNEAATAAFAEDVAAVLRRGDVLALSGGLGAGKTTFARALLRALADDAALEVPSPTFTLVQTYATPRLTVAHFDLYRIADAGELDELGFAEAAEDGAVIVEWPERAGERLAGTVLTISFSIAGTGRRIALSGGGILAERLARSRDARAFLEGAGRRGAARRYLQGDASTRTYERIGDGSKTTVLMDWPPRGQLTAGDPRAAFRARNAGAFVAVDRALRDAGLSAPEIYAADVAAGFVLMEDLGAEGIISGDAPIAERYRIAVEALASLHAHSRSREISGHRLPELSGAVLLAEVGIFADWYVPHATGIPLAAEARDGLMALWRALDAKLQASEQSWVLFDVQSPNLFWLPERSAVARVGFIDFQDMFFGPAAYDVASLCQDARIDMPPQLQADLEAHYIGLRRAADSAFDADSFRAAFAVASALRNFKNMGAFARLAAVGNPIYLKHLPRLRAYLARALSHPVLSPLAVWYERHLPP